MKRKFLEELQLSKEVIDSIMAEYGKSFTSKDNEILELKELLESKDNEFSSYKNDSILSNKLKELNIKNEKAFKALLDFEKISYEDNDILGLDEQVESLKKSDAYIFEEKVETKIKIQGLTPSISNVDSDLKDNSATKTVNDILNIK